MAKNDGNETKDVAVPVITGMAKDGERPIDRLKTYLQNRAELDGVDLAYDVAASQIDKMMELQTAEEVWESDNLSQIGGRDLVDVEQHIQYYTVHKSNRTDINSPLGVFLMVHSTRLDNGEELVWDTSAPLLVSKLRALEAIGALPCDAVIRGYTAGNGVVLKLRPVPKRVVQQ